MLKIEPGEAARILLPRATTRLRATEQSVIDEGVATMRKWRLYRIYDLRFVYSAPPLKRVTERLEWSPDSPAFQCPELAGFVPRISSEG